MRLGTGNAEASITLHFVVVPPGILTIAKVTSFLVRAACIYTLYCGNAPASRRALRVSHIRGFITQWLCF